MPLKLGSWKNPAAKDRIFISDRRADARGYAGRLEDTLKSYFGVGRVFRDIGGINPGEDLKAAPERKRLIIPVLVDGASMPREEDLNEEKC
jgi:hypothetical protein